MSLLTAPRTGSRLAVALSAAALVTSAGFAGGPALAKALNAHTVDGKHAVGSGASVKARRGKLVATSRRTGRLPDDIIARAPDATRLAGRPASSYLLAREADEVVQAGGIPATTPLPAVGVSTSSVGFTTRTAGRLVLDLTGSGQLMCPSSSFVHWWIRLDGEPVLSSRMQLGEAAAIDFTYAGFPSIHLTGATAGAVAPGDHVAQLVGGCSSGANGGSASTGNPGLLTATVAHRGIAPTARPATARARSSCVTAGGGESCR